jgi:hypothetical protein
VNQPPPIGFLFARHSADASSKSISGNVVIAMFTLVTGKSLHPFFLNWTFTFLPIFEYL